MTRCILGDPSVIDAYESLFAKIAVALLILGGCGLLTVCAR
jgi:hypothetical protein